jgi:DNA-binding NtrC family response regulator
MRLLCEYDWPGNVRELENFVKRMVILGTDESIRREVADAIAARTAVPSPIPALQPTPAGAAPVPAAPRFAGAQPAPAAPWPVPVANGNGSTPGSLKDIARNAAREAERAMIFRTLQQTRWNRREAAELLGISYKALLYKIKEANFDRAW